MHLAIVSDIHDQVWNLALMLTSDPLRKADALLCCGDLCSPFVVAQLAKGFAGPIHIVFGNNDGDLYRITQNAAAFDHVHVHGELFHAELGGKRFLVNHFPNLAEQFSADACDVICYGHNHVYHHGVRGEALVLNPGTLMGYNPVEGQDVPATFMTYDTVSGEVKGYQLRQGEVIPYP